MVSELAKFQHEWPLKYRDLKAYIVGGAPIRRYFNKLGGDIDIYDCETLQEMKNHPAFNLVQPKSRSGYVRRFTFDGFNINVLNQYEFPVNKFDISVCRYSAYDYDNGVKPTFAQIIWENASPTLLKRVFKYHLIGVKFFDDELKRLFKIFRDPEQVQLLEKNVNDYND